jgi:histidinol dehydrogenase
MKRKQKVLVVADRTAEAPELVAALRRRAERSPAGFTLLVPADADGLAWAQSTEAAWSRAISRAELAAERIRAAGLELEETIVGDPDPTAAVGDACHAREFDQVVFWRRQPARALPPLIAAA